MDSLLNVLWYVALVIVILWIVDGMSGGDDDSRW